MRALRVPPIVAKVLLYAASVMLLAQGCWAWAMLLGLASEGANFDTLAPVVRNLCVVLAIACPVAAIGAWFASDWGPVLWAVVVIALGVSAGASTAPGWVGSAFAAHGIAIGLWTLAALRMDRREKTDPVRFG